VIILDSHVQQVPFIAVFTKFETFMHSTRSDMMLKGQRGNLKDECGKRFKERCSDELGVEAKFVRLEGGSYWLSVLF
jgi:hypothetical protein